MHLRKVDCAKSHLEYFQFLLALEKLYHICFFVFFSSFFCNCCLVEFSQGLIDVHVCKVVLLCVDFCWHKNNIALPHHVLKMQ